MYTIKKLLYLLFSFITALGMVLCWFNYFDKPSEPTTTTIKLQSLSGTIIKQKQENLLLSLSPIKNISIDKNYLVAGDDSLSFETDTIQSVAVYLPNKPEVWKNYWSALLGESVQSENFSRWNIALMRLKVALLPEWEKLAQQKLWAKLSDEQRLTYVLVSTIKSNSDYSFFIDGKNLQKTSRNNLKIMDANNLAIVSQPLAPKSQKSLSPLLFGLLTLLSGAAGLFFTKQLPVLSPNIQEIKQEEKPTTETQQLSPINTEEPETSATESANLVKIYIKNFQEKYGDFYTNIELLSEYPTDEPTRQKIKQQLIEMGLHAHSFARAYLFNYLDRPEKEPNTLLIYEQKQVKDLESQFYKVLSLDGHKTNKRYRYLAKIIAEMTINSLEGALLNDTYVSAETFEHLK